MTVDMPALQLAQAIIAALGDRAKGEGDAPSVSVQDTLDASLGSYFASLATFPISRWLALCEGIGAEPGLVAAATHCDGFELQHFQPLLLSADWPSGPWSAAHIAAQFCRLGKWSPVGHELSLDGLLKFGERAQAVAPFVIGAYDRYPRYDIEKSFHELDAAVASLLFFYGARDGLDAEQERRLFDYLKQADGPLLPRFWASFAAILRYPHLHDRLPLLSSLIDDDPLRANAATALTEAINAGPLTPEEASRLQELHAEGPTAARLARSLRFAAFVPGNCPMIDVFAPWPKQMEQAEQVKAAIEQAIASGASFIPDAYAEKARDVQTVETEAEKRSRKIEECLAPRGWNAAMVAEALANGPGIPVLGYPYGSALLRFHPETSLPIVFCAGTGEVIHVGRTGYVYNIDWDAYNAIAEDERPPLPPFEAFSPAAADLETVYVRLKDEWIDVWRPVAGRWMERNVYVLMPREIPGDETQEFWIGHHVECTVRRFGKGIGQTATKLVEWKR